MARQDDLDTLGALLTDIKRLLQRPGYRQRFMSALGVNTAPGTIRVLRAVERLSPPEPFVGELASVLLVEASTATRLIDRAVRVGYLEKVPDHEDQRRVSVRLSDDGRALIDKANLVHQQLLAEVTLEWAEADVHQLRLLLERLAEDLNKLET